MGGRPVKLRRHLSALASAFRRPDARAALPQSIRGLWRADLFVGMPEADRWVGTTVKINPRDLQPARGLRVGVIPAREGVTDRVRLDEAKNLVVCPLPYDGEFMEIFYRGWGIVQQFISYDALTPPEVALPRPPERQVVRQLVDRREFPVVEVIKALGALSQPGLLDTRTRNAEMNQQGPASGTGAVVAPQAMDLTEGS
jgi:hypothetical protein